MNNADIKIEDAGFNMRALNVLSQYWNGEREFETLGDIQKIPHNEMLRLPNCGPKTIQHIMEVLDELGLATDNLQKKKREPKPPNPHGLKGCPFCYSRAKYCHTSELSGYHPRHWVKCTNDGNSEEEDCEARTSYWVSREGAITAWNRRRKRVYG